MMLTRMRRERNGIAFGRTNATVCTDDCEEGDDQSGIFGKELTEHECAGEQGSKRDQEATKTTADVRKLGSLARTGEGGVVGVPVKLRWGSGVAQCMIGEGVRVCTLSVVPFLYRLLSLVTFWKTEVYDNDNVGMTMTDVVGIGS